MPGLAESRELPRGACCLVARQGAAAARRALGEVGDGDKERPAAKVELGDRRTCFNLSFCLLANQRAHA